MRAIGPCLFTMCLAAVEPAPEIPVTTVVLYSSGVGYFEHQGSVDGAAQAQLRFKTGQTGANGPVRLRLRPHMYSKPGGSMRL